MTLLGDESGISFEDKHLQYCVVVIRSLLHKQGEVGTYDKIRIPVNNDLKDSCRCLKIGMVVFLEVCCVYIVY